MIVALTLAAAWACEDPALLSSNALASLADADMEGAAAWHERATSALGCALPTTETLARLWLVEGIQLSLSGDNDQASAHFAAAKRTDDTVWRDTFGEEMAALWSAAEASGASAEVHLAPELDAPWKIYVDGAEQELPGLLPPGLHHLQAVARGEVHHHQEFLATSGDHVTLSHTLPEKPPAPESSGPSAHIMLGVGTDATVGQLLEERSVEASEPGAKVTLPLELGIQAHPPSSWVRLAGSVGPLLGGQYLFVNDQGEAGTSPVAVGGHLAGGPRFGSLRVGALAGMAWPSRIPIRAVTGFPITNALPLELEARAGLNVATDRPPEPALGLQLVMIPSF